MNKRIIYILIFCFVLFEVTVRFFIKFSDDSYGILLNTRIPPYNPIARLSDKTIDNSEWYKGAVLNGVNLTRGDVIGHLRPDDVAGFAVKESQVSKNKIWQSNNIGARSRTDTFYEKKENSHRILVFGDSYTQGMGVSQQEAWPYLLEGMSDNLEVVNLGVAGYSMEQAYLRYEYFSDKLDYDSVLFTFVPDVGLERAMNVFRPLIGWPVRSTLMPRFVVKDNELKRVKSPFENREDYYQDSPNEIGPILRDYLRKNDSFYFKARYEEIPILKYFVTYRLIAKIYADHQEKRLYANILDTDSQAVEVLKNIFQKIQSRLKEEGRTFVLVILPTKDVMDSYHQSKPYQKRWNQLVLYFCNEFPCIDLTGKFKELDSSLYDTGYDGSHYGPKIHKIIAQEIHKGLKTIGLH